MVCCLVLRLTRVWQIGSNLEGLIHRLHVWPQGRVLIHAAADDVRNLPGALLRHAAGIADTASELAQMNKVHVAAASGFLQSSPHA